MRNLIFTGSYYGEIITLQQISKSTAKKLYIEGKDIFLQSSNFVPFGVWSMAYKINKSEVFEIVTGEKFEEIVNSFKYYNCSSETGKYVTFYKKIN